MRAVDGAGYCDQAGSVWSGVTAVTGCFRFSRPASRPVLLNHPVAVVLLGDELRLLVEVTGLDGEPVRGRVGGLVLLDRDCQRARAVGVAALADERHRLVHHVWLDRDGLLLERHAAVVVVAERQLVLDQPVAAHGFPAIVTHHGLPSRGHDPVRTVMLAATLVSSRPDEGIVAPDPTK
jgi:hypothetical protein